MTIQALDATSVIKASQAIAREIALDRLLERLIQILIENAGAQRGLLVVERDGQFFVEAEGTDEHIDVALHEQRALTEEQAALSVLSYVHRTQDSVVLDDASNDRMFAQDTYLVSHAPHSILCLPVRRRGDELALLYLENNTARGAFTERHLEILHLLAGQAAISLENARLYHGLQEEVRKRTAQLRQVQARVAELEKQATERQMAGGFAHEMRNALMGAKLPLAKALGLGKATPVASICAQTSADVRALAARIGDRIPTGMAKSLTTITSSVMKSQERLDRILQTAYDATTRGLDITRQILDYSQLGQDLRDSEEVDIVQLLEQLVDRSLPDLQDHAIHVERNWPAQPVNLVGNASHMTSVIENLLGNARDALLESDGERRVHITVETRPDGCVIAVEDNGPGMTEETLARLFEPFYTTKPESGRGLGLGVVKKIVGLYGGSIEVDSTRGHGASFRVFWPASDTGASAEPNGWSSA